MGWEVNFFTSDLCYFCMMFIFLVIALPLPPLNASAIIVEQTFLTISWVPRDDANSTLGYSIDSSDANHSKTKNAEGFAVKMLSFGRVEPKSIQSM